MVEGFNFRKWLQKKEKTVAGMEVDKNANQFEAAEEFLKHRTNLTSYERYKTGTRTPAVERKKNTKPSA